jgi:hypothetical protein
VAILRCNARSSSAGPSRNKAEYARSSMWPGRANPSWASSLEACSNERYRRTLAIISQQRLDELDQVHDLDLGFV